MKNTVVKNKAAAKKLLKELELTGVNKRDATMQCDCGQTLAVIGIDKEFEAQILIGICEACYNNGWENER